MLKREDLISRLVTRKMMNPGKKPICICMFAATQQKQQPRPAK